jgi:hypothetical protein
MNDLQEIAAPVVRIANVRARLMFDPTPRPQREIDWDAVQLAVADDFYQLAADMAVRLKEARCRPGANRSPAVPLYAYSVFDLSSNPTADPIVVGVSFKRSENGILVRGDICGEESGKIYLAPSACRLLVPQDARRVILEGSAVATRLAREVETLINLLRCGEPA